MKHLQPMTAKKMPQTAASSQQYTDMQVAGLIRVYNHHCGVIYTGNLHDAKLIVQPSLWSNSC